MIENKALLDELATSKAQAPQMKCIRFPNLDGCYSNINMFLYYCIPQNLPLLSLNYYTEVEVPIKISFYLKSLIVALPKVTKEIFLNVFYITESELETIVKVSCNSERLVFYGCDLKCAKKMSFKRSSAYSIKYLGFNWCGGSYRKTEWLSNPSLFSNIVSAIGGCGLRNSLVTLNVYKCSLAKRKVQQMLNDYNLNHINLIDKPAGPLPLNY